MEKWKQINKWPTLEISDHGNLRYFKTKKQKYIYISKQGYYTTVIKQDNKNYTLKIHRLVAETFLEPPSNDLLIKCKSEHWGVVCVNHKDGVKTNNHISNLEWCDMAYNNSHARDNNMVPSLKGSSNGRSKLTEEIVHEICRLFQDTKLSIKDIHEMFDISIPQLQKIRANLAWKHIRSLYNIEVLRKRRLQTSTTIENTEQSSGSE